MMKLIICHKLSKSNKVWFLTNVYTPPESYAWPTATCVKRGKTITCRKDRSQLLKHFCLVYLLKLNKVFCAILAADNGRGKVQTGVFVNAPFRHYTHWSTKWWIACITQIEPLKLKCSSHAREIPTKYSLYIIVMLVVLNHVLAVCQSAGGQQRLCKMFGRNQWTSQHVAQILLLALRLRHKKPNLRPAYRPSARACSMRQNVLSEHLYFASDPCKFASFYC